MKNILVVSAFALLVTGACSPAATSPTPEDEPHAIDEQMPAYANRIILPGDARSVDYPGHGVNVLAEKADTEAGIYIQEEIIPPKSLGAPPHMHADEDEYFFVLEGEVSFLNGDKTVVVGPGSAAILPRGHWHGFWNHTDSPTRMLLTVAPGDFGDFFDAVVMKVREDNADNPQAIGAIIGQLAAERNVTVDMSRLPPDAVAILFPPASDPMAE